MIISASRRTDIPCYYSEWMLNRLKQGRVLLSNPWNANRLGSVVLSPQNVDCIVFWTKNPEPMLARLTEIDQMGYRYYFSFTITAYGKDIEPNLPEKRESIECFKRLSDRLEPDRVDWRFDPILKDPRYPPEMVYEHFADLCGALHEHTERCIVSFANDYSRSRQVTPFSAEDMLTIAKQVSKIAEEYHLPLFSCSEEIELGSLGIQHSCCIDQGKIEKIIGSRITAKKDPGQRAACGCIESVDIGAYDTCCNGCSYCYAVRNEKLARKKRLRHNPDHELLTGEAKGTELITDRTSGSRKISQISLFDYFQGKES